MPARHPQQAAMHPLHQAWQASSKVRSALLQSKRRYDGSGRCDFVFCMCRPPRDKEYDACKASAAGLLAFRPHTRSELATKLTDKGYDKACIERSISRLQELARLALYPCT